MLNKIKNHRNKISSHIYIPWINSAINETLKDEFDIDLNQTQNLLKAIIVLLKKASFIPDGEKAFLDFRIGPKDVQDILGLKTKNEILKKARSHFFTK